MDPDVVNNSGEVRLPHHFPPHVYNSLFSTPIKQHMGTARLPDEQTKISVNKLAHLLDKELSNNCISGPAFICLIFPDQLLPIPVDDTLFEKLVAAKIWDSSKAEFLLNPSSYSENDVAKWLNSLAKGIEKCFPNYKTEWSWYAGNKMVAPKGSAIV